ncbi:MAG: hypothetical protein R6V58_15935 [Planctomycetota bacterium]
MSKAPGCGLIVVLVMAASCTTSPAAEMGAVEGAAFKVRRARPRVFIRAEGWRGPSVAKMERWFQLPEYKKRGVGNWPIFQYLATGDRETGKRALARLAKRKIGGRSPSYSGKSAQIYAATYDWLREHPDFDPAKRKEAVAHLEHWGDYFTRYLTRASAPIYYSRYPGAISGLTAIGLALYGDSPKADGYIKLAHKSLLEYGKARQYEGGATGGGNYSLYHVFPDLGRAVTAFESATDAGVLDHIRGEQGDWLRRQLEFQIWYTLPTGYFVKEGDQWRNHDNAQMRSNVDILTHLLHDGHGRTFANQIHKRYGTKDYHGGYVWDFFLFNNPEIEPEPLSGLGRATVFGRKSHGYVFFRSGWEEDDTVVFFKCGESLDTHGSRSTAHFDVWRRRSLVQRGGPWYNVKTRGGSSWHNNTMHFVSEGDAGSHPNTIIKRDMKLDVDAFLEWKKGAGVEAGDIVEFEVKDDYARVLADATAATKSCKSWTRELVWLGYHHLLVLDRVETLGKPVKQTWMLFLKGERRIDGTLATASLGGSKLFCRTLLPEDATLAFVETKKGGTRLEVRPPDDRPGRRVYLHVITALPETADEPKASVRREGKKLVVTVGNRSYTFEE